MQRIFSLACGAFCLIENLACSAFFDLQISSQSFWIAFDFKFLILTTNSLVVK